MDEGFFTKLHSRASGLLCMDMPCHAMHHARPMSMCSLHHVVPSRLKSSVTAIVEGWREEEKCSDSCSVSPTVLENCWRPEIMQALRPITSARSAWHLPLLRNQIANPILQHYITFLAER